MQQGCQYSHVICPVVCEFWSVSEGLLVLTDRPKGWLGLILGTRMYYSFLAAEQDDEAAFEKRLDTVVREIGDRGKPKRVHEGVPPAPAPTPAPAPAPRPRAAPAPAPAPATAPAPAPATAALVLAATSDWSFTPTLQTSAQLQTADALPLMERLRELEAQLETQREENVMLREEAVEAKVQAAVQTALHQPAVSE